MSTTNAPVQGTLFPFHNPEHETVTGDAVDALLSCAADCLGLRRFIRFHHKHPKVLHHLVNYCVEQSEPFSIRTAWEHIRWNSEMDKTETFKLQNGLAPWYARVVLVLHPALNGQMEVCRAEADKAFGLRIARKKLPGDYAPRLEWADGSPLESRRFA